MKKLLFIILVCISTLSYAQDFTGEHIGATIKVKYAGSKPVITDFFNAYNNWCITACDENEYDRTFIANAKKTADIANGYLKYEDKNASSSYSYIECCYWNMYEKSKIIFAVNYVNAFYATANTIRLDFFEYDKASAVMRKILPPTDVLYNSGQWYEHFSPTEMRNVQFALPQRGKDITVYIKGCNEQGESTSHTEYLKWNGCGFSSETSNVGPFIDSLYYVLASVYRSPDLSSQKIETVLNGKYDGRIVEGWHISRYAAI